jgi:hypothetical protein
MDFIPIPSPCAAVILNLFDSQVREVFMASAFLRIEAVSEMLARLLKGRTTPCHLRVLTRGSFSDIVAGASDLASLALLSKAHHAYLSIECRRDPRLHAKTYVVNASKAIITSANLTPPGLLTNIEFGMLVDSSDAAKNILDYFEPIWKMAERFDESVLEELSAGAEDEGSEQSSEMEVDAPPRIIRRRQPQRLKRSLARLPKTETVKLSAGWGDLNDLGMDLESTRAMMASGTLNKTLRRTLRVYDKTKRLDIGSGDTMSPEEVALINNVGSLKEILASPNWELRDAAAEALGNIFGDKATQALFEALRREDDRDVLWSILISLQPRISENNLDHVLELLNRTKDSDLVYLIFLIAATVKPKLYGAELIRHIPNIYDNEYIQEVGTALRGLSDTELVGIMNGLKDLANTLSKATRLFSLARLRGDEIEKEVRSFFFSQVEESANTTPMLDWVVNSLFKRQPTTDKTWSELISDPQTEVTDSERSLLNKSKTSPKDKPHKD